MSNPHHENVCEAMADRSETERLTNLVDRLRMEAQIHAQEARTANATIYEIYQCVTQGMGEPGNWNGAVPVIAKIDHLRAIQKAAWDYFNYAVQDEAEERDCCVDDEQHRLACVLRDALDFHASASSKEAV